ncbi:DUF1697 domain-containing protein [Schlegelella sp. S2-27]|uniref:DUF1697 domain-containing protein n=1 Tax=Caldimonas mangrovi TaxID=2944811 RepID=A0ABT0YLA1_9BURK|nr:DUF1697 domain-containing protein [Caldimonas mangrovi]MCM5679511.1 DUF1697 domain-containing protein [Caldimonas mangrovi]
MKYVAFFRNLNLGRPHCPTRTEFEAAFLTAGATSAQSFLTNGTMVFAPAPGGRPRVLLSRACALLRQACGLREPAFLRRVDELASLVAADPFGGIDRSDVYECCVTFLHPHSEPLEGLPFESPRRDLQLLRHTGTEVLSVSRKVGNTPGSPNALLEKRLGLPATTRSWNTVVRVVERHAG